LQLNKETSMNAISPSLRDRDLIVGGSGVADPGAVSWGAIFAGAAGAAALSLILLILGVGLGLSSVSPWSGQGIGATAFGASTVAWLTFTQLAASGMGGYLAGRLRSRWAGTHTDEIYFRDTAHGFLAWAVASLVTAAMLSSAVGAIVSGGAQLGASVVGGAASTAAMAVPGAASAAGSHGIPGQDYFMDSLFRNDGAGAAAPAADASGAPATAASTSAASPSAPGLAPSAGAGAGESGRTSAEAGRIFANGIAGGSLSPEDTKYVGQLIAQRTGMSQADAEKRVTDTFARIQTKMKDAEAAARDAADKARKTSAYAALWIFVSLLTGAFIASLSATYGGRRRDMV
jgi:hypothetical protein